MGVLRWLNGASNCAVCVAKSRVGKKVCCAHRQGEVKLEEWVKSKMVGWECRGVCMGSLTCVFCNAESEVGSCMKL